MKHRTYGYIVDFKTQIMNIVLIYDILCIYVVVIEIILLLKILKIGNIRPLKKPNLNEWEEKIKISNFLLM